MKVTRTGFTCFENKNEEYFYDILKSGVKRIFNLNVSELPVIFKKLGIKLPNEIVEYYFYLCSHIAKIVFSTGEVVEFHFGYMTSPYPFIIYNDEEWRITAKDRRISTFERFQTNNMLYENRK